MVDKRYLQDGGGDRRRNRTRRFRSLVSVPLFALVAGMGFALPTIAGAADEEVAPSEVATVAPAQSETEAPAAPVEESEASDPVVEVTPAEDPADEVAVEETDAVDEGAAEEAAPAEDATEGESRAALQATRADGTPTQGGPFSCGLDVFYSISSSGQIQTNASGSTVPNIDGIWDPHGGWWNTGAWRKPTSANGLGISADGTEAFAYDRKSGGLQFYHYKDNHWTYIGDWETSNAGSYVAGAVNPVTGDYMFGRFGNNGTDFYVYKLDPTSYDVSDVGYTEIPRATTNNGDMAFNADGSLQVIRGRGSNVDLFTISAAALQAGGNMTNSKVVDKTGGVLRNVSGGAFNADGTLWLGAGSQAKKYDPDPVTGGILSTKTLLNGTTDLASCTAPPSLAIEKNLEGNRYGDEQFEIDILVPNSTEVYASGVTAGTGNQIDPQSPGVNPTVVRPNTTYKFQEVLIPNSSGAELSDYLTSWECRDQNETLLDSGKNTDKGEVTIPDNVYGKPANVVCVITNVTDPDPAKVTWNKVDADGDKLAGSEWTLTGPDGEVAVVDCTEGTCEDADQNAVAGEFLVEGLKWGEYTLTETKAPAGYEKLTESIGFTVGKEHTTNPLQLDDIVNTELPASVAWNKVDAAGVKLAGSEWTLTGPDGEVAVVDCTEGTCEDADQNAVAGEFLVEGLKWGEYTLTETKAPAGYEKLENSVKFKLDASNTAEALQLADIVNTELPASVAWNKVDAAGVKLAGSEWTLTGPDGEVAVVDCTEGTCEGADQNAVAGEFLVEGLKWGEYTLTETKAPAGYEKLENSVKFKLDASNTAEALQLADIENKRVLGSVTWSKVDDSLFGGKPLSGSEWSLTGPSFQNGVTVKDWTGEDGYEGLDKDPAAGKFKVEDLEWGEYTLAETKAPAGYKLAKIEESFTIGANSLDKIFDKAFVNEKAEAPALPLTGGVGTMLYILIGTLTLGGAGAFAIATYRRREAA